MSLPLPRRRARPRARAGCRPRLEALEDRATPATITWVNPAGGPWDVPANWDLGRTPQPDDDVVIGRLNFGAVVDHAGGDDTVRSVSSPFDVGTLAVTDLSSLTVTGSVNVPTLSADTGGAVTANNTGTLNINLRAEAGGAIHLPALTGYNATVFTRIEAIGPGGLIDLPALTSLMATTGDPVPGEVRLDLIADQGGTVSLPALTSVRGHPPDYFVGYTALRASNGGTFVLDTSDPVTFAAAGSLDVDPGAAVEAGAIVVSELGDVTVGGSLAATSVLVRDSSVTVSGSLDVSGAYTAVRGTTTLEGGTVTAGDLFDNQVGSVYGSGVINGDVRNAGLLSAGALTINGDYTQTAGGTQYVFIGGLQAGSQYSQLVVHGLATLDGTLDVQLINGFRPQPGDQFQVLLFGEGRGTFAHQTGASASFTFVYVFGGGYTLPPGLTLVAN
jgi:hypothetical protein